ncbi:hypothetical protein HK105_202299 [Polyrhizophydium stewartii]|uniref:non-specific serine/threonine protein kinase n=1 Tax=Polyrhizophydium stewartii TaxID=2732419 RepID=A0ABR4NFT3_9FUNG
MGCGTSKTLQAHVQPYRYVTIENFLIQRPIGKGGFGKVCIVERKSDRTLFALKYTEKTKANKDRALHYILQERNILEDIHHPYICSMRYSFQDQRFLYMVLDLMGGGDLRFHLKNMKRIPEAAARIVIAEISSAIAYLHSMHIVHRDIKPDNVLLDKAGHAHLSDFNVAVQYTGGTPLKSVAGTEPYMAPEMLLGQGYFGAVDWWSLGVTMFEIIFGERPFRSKQRRELIKKCKWRFPADQHEVSEDCMMAISEFLRPEPSRRLGHGHLGFEGLQHHPFFVNISWSRLQTKSITPVFVPHAATPNFSTDSSNDELVMFLKNPQAWKPAPEEAEFAAEIVPEFLVRHDQQLVVNYYDYTVIDISVFRPMLHLETSIGDHSSSVLPTLERVNTNFDTNNASFISFATHASHASFMMRGSSVHGRGGMARSRHASQSGHASHMNMLSLTGSANADDGSMGNGGGGGGGGGSSAMGAIGASGNGSSSNNAGTPTASVGPGISPNSGSASGMPVLMQPPHASSTSMQSSNPLNIMSQPPVILPNVSAGLNEALLKRNSQSVSRRHTYNGAKNAMGARGPAGMHSGSPNLPSNINNNAGAADSGGLLSGGMPSRQETPQEPARPAYADLAEEEAAKIARMRNRRYSHQFGMQSSAGRRDLRVGGVLGVAPLVVSATSGDDVGPIGHQVAPPGMMRGPAAHKVDVPPAAAIPRSLAGPSGVLSNNSLGASTSSDRRRNDESVHMARHGVSSPMTARSSLQQQLTND